MKIEVRELELIGCYLGLHDGKLFLEDKDLNPKYTFDFDTTVIKWHDVYFRPLQVRGFISAGPHTTYRFEKISENEINTDNVVEVDSSIIDNAVMLFEPQSKEERMTPKDERIQTLEVQNLKFVLKDYIRRDSVYNFYAYYGFNNK